MANLRLSIFYKLLKPFSDRHREKRMQMFFSFLSGCHVINPRILDLGGDPIIWGFVSKPLEITILNLPGVVNHAKNTIHSIKYLEGDACDVAQFSDNAFDIVFSNSVIEHVGDHLNQERFAQEVHRLAKYHWVQTPSKYFPIEAHCGMPFWWYWPTSLRKFFISRWRQKLPNWTEMIEGTTVLSKMRLQELFPSSKIKIERTLGFIKSYIAHN